MTSDDPEVLREIARQGDRRHLLWELVADGRDFCGVEFTRIEAGLEDAGPAAVAERFITDVNRHLEESPINFDALEETHGQRADEIMAQVNGGA